MSSNKNKEATSKGKIDYYFRKANDGFSSSDLPLISGHNQNAPSHRSSGFVSVDETSSSSVLTDEDDESDVSEVSPFDETEDSTESSDSWIQNMKSKFDGGESILKLAPKLLHNTVKMIRDAGMEWICGDLNVTEEDLTTLLEFFEKTCDEIEKDSRDNKTTSSKRANADDGAGLSYNKRRKIIKDPQTNADILEQDLFLDKSFINYDPVLKRFSCMAENCPNSDGKFILANFAGHLLYEHFKGTFVCSEQINGKKCLKKHAQRHQLYQHLHKQHKIGVRDDRLKNLNQQNPHYVQLVKYLKALQNVEDSKTFVGAPTHKTRKARPGAFLNESPALDQIKEWMKDFDGKEAQVFQDAWEGERPLFSLTNGTLNIVGSTKDASELIVFLPFDNGDINVLFYTKQTTAAGIEINKLKSRKRSVTKSLRECRSNADSIGYGAIPLPQFSVVGSFCEKGTGTQGEPVSALNEVKNLYRNLLKRTGDTNAVKVFTLAKCDAPESVENQAMEVIQKYKSLLVPAIQKWKMHN